MEEVGMPDVNQGATFQHIYDWLYNGGSYGKNPSIVDMLAKGWGFLLESHMIYPDTTNKDIRAAANFDQKDTNLANIVSYTNSIRQQTTYGATSLADLLNDVLTQITTAAAVLSDVHDVGAHALTTNEAP